MRILFAGLLLWGTLNVPLRGGTIHFDDAAPGGVPPGWTSDRTGKGEAKWAVAREDSAPSRPNVLKQSGEAAYPVCLKDEPAFQDGFVEVKFKAVAGKQDQAGGVIWRAQDADNYYVCRANALEDNVTLYKTVAGKRTVLDIVGRTGGYGVAEKVAARRWHTLRVEFAASRFKIIFNGQALFEVEDHTFKRAGKVGLWTKADSVTLFDDFSFSRK